MDEVTTATHSRAPCIHAHLLNITNYWKYMKKTFKIFGQTTCPNITRDVHSWRQNHQTKRKQQHNSNHDFKFLYSTFANSHICGVLQSSVHHSGAWKCPKLMHKSRYSLGADRPLCALVLEWGRIELPFLPYRPEWRPRCSRVWSVRSTSTPDSLHPMPLSRPHPSLQLAADWSATGAVKAQYILTLRFNLLSRDPNWTHSWGPAQVSTATKWGNKKHENYPQSKMQSKCRRGPDRSRLPDY